MLKKKTINKALTELCNNKVHHIDENTLNLINNLLLALPDDDAWTECRTELPTAYEAVDMVLDGYPEPAHGHLLNDGSWMLYDAQSLVIPAEKVVSWRPLRHAFDM